MLKLHPLKSNLNRKSTETVKTHFMKTKHLLLATVVTATGLIVACTKQNGTGGSGSSAGTDGTPRSIPSRMTLRRCPTNWTPRPTTSTTVLIAPRPLAAQPAIAAGSLPMAAVVARWISTSASATPR